MRRTIKALLTAGVVLAAVVGAAAPASAAIVTSQASLVNGQLMIVGSGAVPTRTSRWMMACPRARRMPGATFHLGEWLQRAELRGHPVRRIGVGRGHPVGLHPGNLRAAGRARRSRCDRAAVGCVGDRAGGLVLAASGGRAGGELPVGGEHPPGAPGTPTLAAPAPGSEFHPEETFPLTWTAVGGGSAASTAWPGPARARSRPGRPRATSPSLLRLRRSGA